MHWLPQPGPRQHVSMAAVELGVVGAGRAEEDARAPIAPCTTVRQPLTGPAPHALCSLNIAYALARK